MLDQSTVMIDFQSSSSSICFDFQKRDERTMPDEERAADSSMVTGGSDPSDDFPVPLDDPNEKITEQWHDDLHEWYICRDDQCPVQSTRISRDVSPEARPPQSLFMSQTPFRLRQHKRRHMNVTPTVPQETLVSCLHRSHQLLLGSTAVPLYLTCLDCRHHAKWTHRTGPTFQQFPELQRMVQALQRRQG